MGINYEMSDEYILESTAAITDGEIDDDIAAAVDEIAEDSLKMAAKELEARSRDRNVAKLGAYYAGAYRQRVEAGKEQLMKILYIKHLRYCRDNDMQLFAEIVVETEDGFDTALVDVHGDPYEIQGTSASLEYERWAEMLFTMALPDAAELSDVLVRVDWLGGID